MDLLMDLHHQIKVLEVRSFIILSHLLKQKQLTKDTYMDFFFLNQALIIFLCVCPYIVFLF